MKKQLNKREEELEKFIKIPPKRKLEWLQLSHEFLYHYNSKQMKKVRKILRKF